MDDTQYKTMMSVLTSQQEQHLKQMHEQKEAFKKEKEYLNEYIKNLHEDLEDHKKLVNDTKVVLQELKDVSTEQKQQLDQQKDQLFAQNELIKRKDYQIQSYQLMLETLSNEITELKETNSALVEANKALIAENGRIQTQLAELAQKYTDAVAQIEILTEKLDDIAGKSFWQKIKDAWDELPWFVKGLCITGAAILMGVAVFGVGSIGLAATASTAPCCGVLAMSPMGLKVAAGAAIAAGVTTGVVLGELEFEMMRKLGKVVAAHGKSAQYEILDAVESLRLLQ